MAPLSEDDINEKFHRFNETYFGGRLPDVEIELQVDLRLDGCKRSRLWGATSKDESGFRIQLQRGMSIEQTEMKLAHEMVHVAVWPKSHRSKAWRDEVKRLGQIGFLAEVL